jgi:SAM-dependent methyltransferase
MKNIAKKILSCFANDYVDFQGIRLPKRRSNQGLTSSKVYMLETERQIRAFDAEFNSELGSILDFGCGQGRLLNGLIYTKTKFVDYVGMDVDALSIQWCLKNITYNQNIAFLWYNKGNERYNKSGQSFNKIPLEKNYFQLVFSNSVFSHLTDTDVRLYAKLLREVIADSGMLYLTAFTEEEVPNVEENPDGYMGAMDDKSALHRVRFNKNYFINIFIKEGWDLVLYKQNAIARTGQSELFFRPS